MSTRARTVVIAGYEYQSMQDVRTAWDGGAAFLVIEDSADGEDDYTDEYRTKEDFDPGDDIIIRVNYKGYTEMGLVFGLPT